MIVGAVIQQPWEIQDYDLEYDKRLAGSPADVIEEVSVVITPSDGTLNVNPVIAAPKVVKLWVQGGEDGEQYTVEVRARTQAGRQSESELIVQIGDFK